MKSIFEGISQITALLGTQVSTETLSASTTRTDASGVDFRSVGEFLRSEGFDNHLSHRSLEDIPSLTVPLLLLLNLQEAIVVVRIDGVGQNRQYHVLQPGGLRQTISHKALMDIYSGYCWFIQPQVTQDHRSELPEYDMTGAWFYRVLWRFKAYYWQVILASFIINFLALVSSLYVMNVYDRVIPNRSWETLWMLSIGVILAILFECTAKLIRSYLTDIAGKKADLIISTALLRRVMSIKMSDRPASSGSYANNLREFESVREFMTSATLLTFVDLPFIFLFIGVIWLVGGWLAAVPLTLVPIVVMAGILLQRPLSRHINASMRESSQRQGLLVEALDGIETLKLNNAVNWIQRRWDGYTACVARSSIRVKNTSNLIICFSAAVQQLNTVLLVILGTYLIHSDDPHNRITMGALVASVILSGRALAPLGHIASLATRFQQARLAMQGVNEIAHRPVERESHTNYLTVKDIQGEFRFRDITFTYKPGLPTALSELSVCIRPGEKVGIIGSIGCGKSTLLKMMVGLYRQDRGDITLDGVSMQQLDPYFIREKIYLLEQNPRLFLGSLRENLQLSRLPGSLSDVDMINAAGRLGFDRFIRHHPRGLDMQIGEGGQGLSGGQKQMVALTRMVLCSPQVVLLDEPTTCLDLQTEAVVLNGLSHWCRGRTLVVVTHRLQVLNIVDRLIVMKEGRVMLDGPRKDILKKISGPQQSDE
ncbi:type I secretion system permease/ATPase [Salmonella enterica subsp. salamae]|nr:type I secretion system permease/ATPase [Salmonella enterica subsp. salamae]ECF5956680.1 type I secretion system permease/ATPase [Salmonella enterica subsp. salamae]ECF6094601.1 type I secretion system permease/ATPase [Salmonella enterica subsp. salamae]EDW5993989.1 type I secretion system permease/ATPase [Salmonella enterica subsp. salamae]